LKFRLIFFLKFHIKKPKRIVVIGELLFNRNANNWGNRKDGYTFFENYKDNSVEEIMRSQEDGEFRNDLFSSFYEYMDFLKRMNCFT